MVARSFFRAVSASVCFILKHGGYVLMNDQIVERLLEKHKMGDRSWKEAYNT